MSERLKKEYLPYTDLTKKNVSKLLDDFTVTLSKCGMLDGKDFNSTDYDDRIEEWNMWNLLKEKYELN